MTDFKQQGKRNRINGRDYERKVYNHLAAFFSYQWEVLQRNRSGYEGDDLLLKRGVHEISIDCKNVKKITLSEWVQQAKGQAGGIKPCAIIHRRRGKGDVSEHYVTMTVDDFTEILTWVDGR